MMKPIFILLSLVFGITLFAKNVATITAIKGDAAVQRAEQKLSATLGQKLQPKDVILTKNNAKLQVIFNDETIISIGKNSEFSIENYLFEENKKPVAKFGMLRGAIRTITGKIGKIAPQKFSVTTKTATIGIRGTNFSVFVNDDGSTEAFCTFGAISVSIAQKLHLVQQGYFLHISPKGKIVIKAFDAKILKQAQTHYFALQDTQKVQKTPLRDAITQEELTQNNAQIDVTLTDDSGLITTNVADTVTDATQQNTTTTLTENSYIASLQNIRSYQGTYTANGTSQILSQSGTADLTVDFGNDTGKLTLLGDLNNNGGTIEYKFKNLSTNTFSGTNPTVTQGLTTGATINGSADGKFYGATAGTVKGSYSFTNTLTDASLLTKESGTYTVTQQ